MKHQQVSVDYWAMGKAMVTYGALTALVWLMLRLFNAVFMLPRRLRAQHESMEATLKELQRRYPDLNITEEDLKNAEKELEELTKEHDTNALVEDNNRSNTDKNDNVAIAETQDDESKKTI